jgi:hypothetical protein
LVQSDRAANRQPLQQIGPGLLASSPG